MASVKTSLAPKRNHITHITRKWSYFRDELNVLKQALNWDKALLLVVHRNALGLSINIARNLKRQRLA
ncbi:hypothetical protein [Vibrio nitrifigilis]|uniref:hypothetical protein n=1 Tax=Vibrio nitrifigilis TaxID=2789781 RepID=UPI001E4FC1B5|nr:hypothetical protein [Vibrio nitrifigilis]